MLYHHTLMKARRGYTKVARAAAEEATRERIVSAVMALHEEVGPARTTISAVAERAGVERLTVYRHFPDEAAILHACSAHWGALHPMPKLPVIADDPLAACRRTFLSLYRWYRENAATLANITADAERMPVLAALLRPFASELDRIASHLERTWRKRTPQRSATIRHALEFSTWRSLDRIARTDRRAAAIACSWLTR
jgi:AcrR family transcriptional regulator